MFCLKTIARSMCKQKNVFYSSYVKINLFLSKKVIKQVQIQFKALESYVNFLKHTNLLYLD